MFQSPDGNECDSAIWPEVELDEWCGEHPDFPEYIKGLKKLPENTNGERKPRVITPEQRGDGYMVLRGTDPAKAERREFQVIRRLEDGNYLVIDPGSQS